MDKAINHGRSDQELRDAATHVDHEINMLNELALWLSSHDDEMSTGQVVAKACLESFILHARNLIDLLYPPPRVQPDDILAEHFFKDAGEWERRRPSKVDLLEKSKKRADKLAAHLTYERSKLDKWWDFHGIQAELQTVITCFFDHLPPDRKAWFAAAGPQA